MYVSLPRSGFIVVSQAPVVVVVVVVTIDELVVGEVVVVCLFVVVIFVEVDDVDWVVVDEREGLVVWSFSVVVVQGIGGSRCVHKILESYYKTGYYFGMLDS